MPTFVYRNGELVDKRFATPLVTPDVAPHVISDTMPATRHMATNRVHTSKAAFRADTKASGCIEVGNDSSLGKVRAPVPLSREKRREDIRRTIYELRNGRS